MLTTWPALTEAMHLLGEAGGWTAQQALWGLVESGDLKLAELTDALMHRARELMEKYRDCPMDLADATLVAVAESRRLRDIFTLDQQDFRVYRPAPRQAFRFWPRCRSPVGLVGGAVSGDDRGALSAPLPVCCPGDDYMRAVVSGVVGLWVVVAGASVMAQPGQPAVGGSAAPVRRPVTPREVLVVYPLVYFQDTTGQLVGECLAARLEIGGAPAGRVRIGVYEPEVGGTTDVWRAAAWSAALIAAQVTDFDPRAMQLSVEVRRSTDGPSAGALLAVGLISAIRGEALHDHVVMTGTINPDGTIGPVGGITLKIEGAARAGKKLVLVPFGQVTDADPRTGRQVNLVQYGWQQGVEVRPVRDVWGAYAAFTGVEIPRPEPAAVPNTSAEINALMLDRINRWIKLTRTARDKYDSWPAYTHTEFSESMLDQSRDLFDRASEYLESGDTTAAYMDVVTGALYSWMAHEFGRYVYQLPTGRVDSITRLPMQNEWLVKEIDETTAAMRAFRPRTFEQMAMYLNAGLVYFEGLCAYEIAEDLKQLHHSKYLQAMLAVEGDQNNSPEQLRQAMFSIFAGVFQIVAWVDMKLATDYLELASKFEGSPLPEQPNLLKIADFYRRGAEANMTVVHELSVIPAARSQEIPEAVARAILPLGDGYYGSAHVGLTRVLPSLHGRLGAGEQYEYVTLAGSMYLHTVTAGLMAKYYSIGVDIGPDLSITGVHREQALTDWLAESRRQTEGSIRALQEQGVDVTTPVQIYWLARTEEVRPKPEDRFFALQRYFYANLMAQILGQLARGESGELVSPLITTPSLEGDGLPPVLEPGGGGVAPAGTSPAPKVPAVQTPPDEPPVETPPDEPPPEPSATTKPGVGVGS